MVKRTIAMLALAAVALLAVGISGCGGGSGASSSPTDEMQSHQANASSSDQADADSREGGAEFRVPGGAKEEVNRIIAGSKEASPEEIEAASEVLEESLEAREDHDWAGQCGTLSEKMEKVVEQDGIVIAANQSCVENLGAAGKKASQEALADTMDGGIGALRLIGGGQAFAFYHGTEGKDYLIPMEREGGEWKVAALTAEAIPRS